jgi:histidinol-phosphate aminotransferase
LAALQDEDFVRRSQAHVALWRPWLTDKLADLGLPATASQANFVTIRIGPDHDAGAAETFLASRGILVRGLGAYGLKEHLRITIGEEAGNRAVVEALSQFLAR